MSSQEVSGSECNQIHQEEGIYSVPPLPSSTALHISISQNEDLMARLKVTLLRLLSLEKELEQIRDENYHLHQQQGFQSDQSLIWKEKEALWTDRYEKLEKQNLLLLREIAQGKKGTESLHRLLDRYKKYHEKVKTQVKPYVHRLKKYAENLEENKILLREEVQLRESQILHLEEKITHLKQDLSRQLEAHRESQRLLIVQYEKEKEKLHRELVNLQELHGKTSRDLDVKSRETLGEIDSAQNL